MSVNNSKAIVSIIMPVKNTAQFLSDCLQSVVNQTYTHWELIAVNDHSTDNSNETLLDFANSDNRIKVLQNKGVGIIDALKTGYAQSSGSYITRMDSDDLMAEQKLQTMLHQLLVAGEGHVATGLVQYFSDTQLGEGYKKYEKWLNNLTKDGRNFSEIYKECVIPSPCWMLSRTDFEKIGGFQPETYPEDYDLCFRMYQHNLKVIACSEILHHWRDYGNRTSRTSHHYADNSFLALKMKYFLQIDFDKTRQLIVWGAGKKGKWVAKYLLENNIAFEWITNNSKKSNLSIYGKKLLHESELECNADHQIIVTVSNETEQNEIKLKTLQSQVFFFC